MAKSKVKSKYNKIVKNQKKLINKDSKITVLSLLKNFYEKKIFSVLIKDYYDSDLDISLTAIESSASIGNEVAIPHLYQIVERGKTLQKKAAIKALAEIGAPSSINMLIKYFNLFQDSEISEEIILALNRISPLNEKVQQLNKELLINPDTEEPLRAKAIVGLIESDNFSFLKPILKIISPSLKMVVFIKILRSGSREVESFIEHFKDLSKEFTSCTLGYYLAAYQLKVENPRQEFILQRLEHSDKGTLISFLQAFLQFEWKIPHPLKVFRIFLMAPYIDLETEALNGDLLERIVKEERKHSTFLLNKLSEMTHAHLETVFSKIKKNYISLKGIPKKESFSVFILANLLERYATSDLLLEIKRFFRKDPLPGPSHIISRITEHLENAPEEDKNRFEACIPLFYLDEKTEKLKIISTLSDIELNRPILLRRLNRLLRIAGALKIKTSLVKIMEILDFAREERISFLEETCIVTLCQVLPTLLNREIKHYFYSTFSISLSSLNGYIRGARFIPPKFIISPLLHLLVLPSLNHYSKVLIVDTLENINLQGIQELWPLLAKSLEIKEIHKELKERIGGIISRYGDSSLFKSLLDLTCNGDHFLKIIAIRALKSIATRTSNIPKDVLTNRLYILLEDKRKEIQIESLLALLALKDDYAIQVLSDYLSSDNEQLVAELLGYLKESISHEVLSLLLKQIKSESKIVHIVLRKVLAELSRGDFATQIQETLIEYSKAVPGTSIGEPQPIQEEESIIEHAKREFKFRRENSQDLTVLFIDISDYTEKSSSMDMSTIIKLIKKFEDTTIPVIRDFKGTLIKKMGDGILVVFKHPLNAVLAALTIQNKIGEYNRYRIEDEKFLVRIGLNTGVVIRKDNDIYGDVVNVASRMETSANPGDILLTQSTHEEIKDYIKCTRLGNIQVKGKGEPITVYSADESVIAVKHIIETDSEKTKSHSENPEKYPVAQLKESIFEPDYKLPANLRKGRKILENLKKLFVDITNALEEIARDYHDEYVFKKYLQEKWKEQIDFFKRNT